MGWYYGVVAIGAGVITAYIIYAVMNLSEKLSQLVIFKRKSRVYARVSKLNPIERLRLKGQQQNISLEHKKVLLIVLLCGSFLAISLPGWQGKLFGFPLGVLVSAFGYLQYVKIKIRRDYSQKLKEAILMYDAVNIYVSKGDNLYQSLEKSLPMLTVLKPTVEKCLKKYHYNPMQALNDMEKDMDFDEARILTSVFMQIDSTGQGAHISGPEAVRLENIRRSLFKTNISLRPLYQQIQLYLPLGCGFSVVAYCFYRHIQVALGSLHGANLIK
ncbi:hypothetical protein [Desulfoscipio gibsoniae]